MTVGYRWVEHQRTRFGILDIVEEFLLVRLPVVLGYWGLVCLWWCSCLAVLSGRRRRGIWAVRCCEIAPDCTQLTIELSQRVFEWREGILDLLTGRGQPRQ